VPARAGEKAHWTFSFLRRAHAGVAVGGHLLERKGRADQVAGELLAACGIASFTWMSNVASAWSARETKSLRAPYFQ